MKKTFLSAILATGLVTSSAALADGHKKDHGFGKDHGSKIYRKLDLSDAQKDQVRSIMKVARGDKQAMRQTMMNNMKARQALIQAPTLDEATLNRMAAEKAEAVKTRFIARVKAEHQVWQILTPEQREKAKKLQEKRAKKMQKRMEKHEKRMKKHDDND